MLDLNCLNMEKINKSLEKEYLTSRIFLEDLEEIQNILKSSKGFKIKAEDFIFSNIDELKSKFSNKILQNVTISASEPFIIIQIKKQRIELYSDSDDLISTGMFYKIDSVISKTALKPDTLYSYRNILIIALSYSFLKDMIDIGVYIFGAIPIICWNLWVGYIRMFKSGEVIVIRREDSKNFFSRNKDQIIIQMSVIIVTIIITSIFNSLF